MDIDEKIREIDREIKKLFKERKALIKAKATKWLIKPAPRAKSLHPDLFRKCRMQNAKCRMPAKREEIVPSGPADESKRK